MKLLFTLLVAGLSSIAFAQNKTLGIGTPTPNPNAAVHVESPTANQGFIMPRLTTAQRTAAGFTSILTATDNGLMVYDSDERVLYIWDGTNWKSSQQVAQANLADEATKLVLPYADTTAAMPNNSNIINIVHNGTGVENVGVAKFENLNPDNGYNPLYVRNFGLNGAAYFSVLNVNSATSALRAYTNSNQPNVNGIVGGSSGTGGSGGHFSITNPANANPALYSTTAGTGPAAKFEKTDPANTSPGLFAITSGPDVAVRAEASGLGSAGNFRVTNPASSNTALYAEQMGTGPSIVGAKWLAQVGHAGYFINGNSANPQSALRAESGSNFESALESIMSGTSSAGYFEVNNAGNSAPAVNITHAGTGNAITANRPIQATYFIGDGSLLTNLPGGGFSLPYSQTINSTSNAFDITNSGNGAAFRGQISGTGYTVHATTSGTGAAGYFENTNASNSFRTLVGITNGTGGAGGFMINNVSNTNTALTADTNGGGLAFGATTTGTNTAGQFDINNSSNSAPALKTQTDGNGNALLVNVTKAGNTQPAISITHAGTGNAITANRPIQASQFIGDGSQLNNVIPSGIIMPFAGASIPAGYLLCDGAAVSRTTYTTLFAAIGTSWGTGDGSTTFNLPDLRGRFLRGVDGGVGNDPDASTRFGINGGSAGDNVGSYQNSKTQDHTHGQTSQFTNSFVTGNGFKYTEVDSVVPNNTVQSAPPANISGESRPINANINYIIKI